MSLASGTWVTGTTLIYGTRRESRGSRRGGVQQHHRGDPQRRVVSVSWSAHPNITGIIYAGAPGEQTGVALVDVLYGAVNPSGRPPFSIDQAEASYRTTIVYNSLGFPVVCPCSACQFYFSMTQVISSRQLRGAAPNRLPVPFRACARPLPTRLR
ncbi:hypothetical protein B0H14DRAFT_1215335 [Mycena olivaceomarginata]|nr:hypothetical protein B0H14DRAFT_1215335 [Mycena olivaceomarginata]